MFYSTSMALIPIHSCSTGRRTVQFLPPLSPSRTLDSSPCPSLAGSPKRRRKRLARFSSSKVRLNIPHSPGEDDANKFRRVCRPCPFVLGVVSFVPIVLSLVSSSRFCLAPGMNGGSVRHPCRCRCDTLEALPVGTELRSLRASPFKEEVHKEKLLYI